jgi:DNA-binding transcriptional LysR family regulator
MNEIDVSRVDLNLLAVLHALLSEGSVTRAAQRLGVGQPAVSHSLTRLRALFEDPLFVRGGRQIAPTPRAAAMREPLAVLLAAAARLVRPTTAFEASTTSRTFVLALPDLLAPVLPTLIGALAPRAPEAQLEVVTPRPDDDRALEDGRVDMTIVQSPNQASGLVRRGLGSLRFAVAARSGHPAKRERSLTKARWAAHPHVLVRTGHGGRGFIGGELQRAGFHRRIGLVVPTFLAALVAVAETDFFFSAPRVLLRQQSARFGLTLFDPPFPIAPVAVAAVWHERFHADPGHRFFRQLVVEHVAALFRSDEKQRGVRAVAPSVVTTARVARSRR